jgi:hypothetical protein
MRTNWRQLAVVALTLAAAAPASAQDAKQAEGDGPSIHRMEFLDGRGGRRVQYYFRGLSPSEEAAIRDAELSENEVAYAEQLLALKRDLVATQRAMQQQQLASLSGNFGIILPPFTSAFIPSTATSPAAPPYSIYDEWAALAFGGPYGYAPGLVGPAAAYGAFGPGDPGVGQGVLARQLAEVSPDTLAQAYRRAINAQQAAAVVLKNPGKSNIRVVGIEQPDQAPRQVTVTLKGGDKVEGTLIGENRDWVIIGTAGGEERVRTADVTRMTIKNK